jgi:hypothetical protein
MFDSLYWDTPFVWGSSVTPRPVAWRSVIARPLAESATSLRRTRAPYIQTSCDLQYTTTTSTDWIIPVFCSIGAVLFICICMYLRHKRRLSKEMSTTVILPQQGRMIVHNDPKIYRYPVFEETLPSAPPLV